MNKTIKKLLGHKYDTRFKWGEFNWHPKFNNWRLGFRLTDRYSEITDMIKGIIRDVDAKGIVSVIVLNDHFTSVCREAC
jgi:hypothetical protein